MKKKAASPTRPYFRALMDYQFRSGSNVENRCGAGLMSRRLGVVRPRLKQDAGGFRPVHLAKARRCIPLRANAESSVPVEAAFNYPLQDAGRFLSVSAQARDPAFASLRMNGAACDCRSR